MEENQEEYKSPYCPICSACGEDGCCPATNCKQHPEGHYCLEYLSELKFGYLMYHKLMKLIDGDDKYKEQVDEIWDKTYDLIFDDNNLENDKEI